MGLFDTVIGTCPHCGGEFASQTKLFDCSLSILEVGANLAAYDTFERLELKEPCGHCHKTVVMVVKEGMFEGLEKDNPQAREAISGSIHHVKSREQENG